MPCWNVGNQIRRLHWRQKWQRLQDKLFLFPNQVIVCREGGSPVMQNRFPKDLGTKILVPRSGYQDLGTKNKRELESMRGGAFQKLSRGHGGLQAPCQRV